MNNIKIDEICFINYRQYGTGKISFQNDKSYNLTAIIAQNGTGKTTLLNSITWCLYEIESKLSDKDAALPVVNQDIVNKSNIGDVVQVSVILKIHDGISTIEFSREQAFKIVQSHNNEKTAIANSSILKATITKLKENTVTKINEEAEIIVRQYFDQDIYDFYFFDGEKLQNFFAPDRSEVIQQSIYNIAQVTLLQSAIQHSTSLRYKYTRKLSKDSPDLQELITQKVELDNAIQVITGQYTKAKSDLIGLTEKREDINTKLRNFEPIRKKQEERDTLEHDLQSVNDDLASLARERSSFVRKYIILLNLYPEIKKTLTTIIEKEKAGDLPPSIDKDQVSRILEHLDDPCPLCNSKIGETGREHLLSLLTKLSVSSSTSNYLKEIKSELIRACEDAEDYRNVKKRINDKETYLSEKKTKIEEKLSEINKFLSSYTESGTIDVSKLERERDKINYDIGVCNQNIGSNRSLIETYGKQSKELDNQIKDYSKQITAQDNLKKTISALEMLCNQFEKVRETIAGKMRRELEQTTWNFFSNMIWKKNTFGKITIDDTYKVSVFNTENNIMTGSMSATEQMALAYAYTLAIHKTSGQNSPLVIDSPLGRVSDENRSNMARSLLEVSKEKQIIMLFTPDEFSTNVRELYENEVNIINLKLSDDEKFVEGIIR